MWQYNYMMHSYPQQDDELYHHGVKGMKWGRRRRRAAAKAANKRYKEKYKARQKEKQHEYTSNSKLKDEILFGAKGQARIEKRVAKGQSKRKARAKEWLGQTAKGLAIGVAMFDISTGGKMTKAAGRSFVNSAIKVKKSSAAKSAARRAAKAIPKLTQKKRFNPIDVAYEILN